MKANAPERIWVEPATDLPKLNGHIDKNSIEYIRKDAFIKKAAAWVSINFDKIGEHYFEYVRDGKEYNPELFIEDFVNYIRGK